MFGFWVLLGVKHGILYVNMFFFSTGLTMFFNFAIVNTAIPPKNLINEVVNYV